MSRPAELQSALQAVRLIIRSSEKWLRAGSQKDEYLRWLKSPTLILRFRSDQCVCELAREGEKLAHEACLETAAKQIAKGLPVIQEPLAAYVAEFLKTGGSNRRSRRGRTRENAPRDTVIWFLIDNLYRERGISPTRNETRDGLDSGCSILAQVLQESGIDISEDGVQKIWQRRKAAR